MNISLVSGFISLVISNNHSSSSSSDGNPSCLSGGGRISEALSFETIGRPVCSSIRLRVSAAILPPRWATFALSRNPLGFSDLEISTVAASATMFNANSIVVMLSRRLSFFKPLKRLYPPVVMPDHSLVIMSVKVAYCCPSFTPERCHSSVSSLRAFMVCSRWFIHRSL